mgnify:CR=1 FL=1
MLLIINKSSISQYQELSRGYTPSSQKSIDRYKKYNILDFRGYKYMNDEIVKQFLDNPVEGRLALSASLKNFIAFFFWYMYRQQFIFRPFHNLIIKKLEDIAFGRAEKKNLIINLPPRHGKSAICQMYCAWCYMLNPHSNCIYTSYSDDLTSSFSKDIRAIIESEAFKTLTGIKLNKAKSGADYWATTIGGGFRAASMGGSITGFGCFSYGTVVKTNQGDLNIGDIVENKIGVRLKSFNLKSKRIEYKKPSRFIKNDSQEFLRIILNDGKIIDCSTDHLFYTNEGIKRADELTTMSILPSNSLDDIKAYSKFFHYMSSRIIFIADKLSLFLCGNVFINRGSVTSNPNSISFSSPKKTGFYVRNITNRCFKFFSNFLVSSRVGCNLFGLLYCKLIIPVMRSVSNAILFVFRLCAISQIFRGVITWISVKMTNYKSLWPFTNKSLGNKRVDSSMGSHAFFGKVNVKIPLLGRPRTQQFIFSNTSDSSDRGDFINSLIFTDRKPLLIYRIGHFTSYCFTIPSNHNFFLGGSQQLLVRNCGVSGNDFGGCLIIDDPNKASSVKSQAELQNTVDYFNNTLKSRLNNQAKTPIIVIMQRLALEDLTGYLLENEADDWDIIKLQGLNEETGEALWEEKYPAAELLKLKKVNPFVYYGQYQQEPIVVGGSVIKTEWFRFYDPKDAYDYQFTFITSDTAQKKGEANDFSVFSFWGKTFDNRLHLIDKVKGKWEADELRQQVKLCWEKWKKFKTPPYGFYIEDKSSGIGVIQEIKKTEPIPIIPIARSRYKNEQGMMVAADKFSRVMTTAPYLANGWVYLPNSEKDDISGSLLAECAAFRADLSHKHDDEVDTLCDAVDIAFGSTGISSIFI